MQTLIPATLFTLMFALGLVLRGEALVLLRQRPGVLGLKLHQRCGPMRGWGWQAQAFTPQLASRFSQAPVRMVVFRDPEIQYH